jgi:glycosyltransferase involved in cell wall biosynthesis
MSPSALTPQPSIAANLLQGIARRSRKVVNQGRALASFIFANPGLGKRSELRAYRQKDLYLEPYTVLNPLVSVCIATYNRGNLLFERSVASVLAQTYTNYEIIVVGDHCTDDTASRMAAISDPRLRFVNLPERGDYPEDNVHRWMVAGTTPMNHALGLARGHFITHLDDDDAYTPDRLSKLVEFLQLTRAELAWHPFEAEQSNGSWQRNVAREFQYASVSTSSVMYHRWFAQVLWDIRSYRFEQPGDWNRFRRFKFLGVKALRHPDSLLMHFRERAQHRE